VVVDGDAVPQGEIDAHRDGCIVAKGVSAQAVGPAREEVRVNAVVGLDLRPFRVVAEGLRDRSDLGRNWLGITTPTRGFGPFSRVSAVGAKKSVWSVSIRRLVRQHKMSICRDFYGSDGTRTGDLRRDRPVLALPG
jgi:hypothetical protein